MQPTYIEPVKNHPRFKQLQKERRLLVFFLSLLVFSVYFTFIMSVVLKPEVLAHTISKGSVITLGIPITLFMIIFSFVMSAVYLCIANRQFDSYTKEIHSDLMKR